MFLTSSACCVVRRVCECSWVARQSKGPAQEDRHSHRNFRLDPERARHDVTELYSDVPHGTRLRELAGCLLPPSRHLRQLQSRPSPSHAFFSLPYTYLTSEQPWLMRWTSMSLRPSRRARPRRTARPARSDLRSRRCVDLQPGVHSLLIDMRRAPLDGSGTPSLCGLGVSGQYARLRVWRCLSSLLQTLS